LNKAVECLEGDDVGQNGSQSYFAIKLLGFTPKKVKTKINQQVYTQNTIIYVVWQFA
jgi:hypothetical protein